MLQLGIIRPSKSSWDSPLHLIHKGRGNWRACDDYKSLNAVTTPDRYPIPYIHNITAIVQRTKLDLRVYH